MPWAVHPSAVARATTSELFPALDRSARIVTLQQVFDAAAGEPMPLDLGLQLGASLAERVATIHAAGRSVGALDAARVRISVDGRVSLARTGESKLAPDATVSPASDIYAAAYLIHQMLTGAPPMPTAAVPPSRFNPKLDAELDAVMLAALREVPEERPASVLALQGALEGLGEELGLKADPKALGRLVEKLGQTPAAPVPAVAAKPPPAPARPSLADQWLANPGPIRQLEDFEDDEDTGAFTRPEPTGPAPWMFAFGAALVMMLTTAVLMTHGTVDEAVPVRTAVVAPPSPKTSRPTLIAIAPQQKTIPTPAPAPSKPTHIVTKHRSHHHRR
jgi:hypothetical protein